MSQWTNCLVIEKRKVGEAAEDLPELRKVPQTIAAWEADNPDIDYCMSTSSKVSRFISKNSASSDVDACVAHYDSGSSGFDELQDPFESSVRNSSSRAKRTPGRLRQLSTKVFSKLRRTNQANFLENSMDQFSSEDPVKWLAKLDSDQFIPSLQLLTISELALSGLAEGISRKLRNLVDEGVNEASIVIVLLQYIAKSRGGARLPRDIKRSIAKAYKALDSEYQSSLSSLSIGYEFDVSEIVLLMESLPIDSLEHV